jgi:capsular exopolysaccharide synthesis family protein
MDLLEKAIEKAQSGAPEAPEPQKQPQEQLITESADIVYSQTRTVLPNFSELRERRVVALQKHDPMADVFRMLRTRVLKQMRQNGWTSLAVTAPNKGAGKSMIATNLAISIAMEVNQTVLLVDFDLRNPRTAWYFDLQVEHGLLDYVQHDLPLSEILINPGIERLVILPGTNGLSGGSSEIISSPKMRRLIEDIKNRYESRIVIFDMPPILMVDDVLAAMDYYDAALLVVEDGENKPEEVTKSLKLLMQTNLVGIVLNKSDTLPEHQGYY